MELGRREFLIGCAGCALALRAVGCAALNPVPLLTADAEGRVSLGDALETVGAQIKVKLPGALETVLVWRGPQGLGAASITCPHRGSEVHFNAAEGTLDCPSHGSRFDLSGQVVHGPATKPLAAYQARVGDGGILQLRRA